LCGPKRPPELEEPGREINHPKRAGGSLKRRLQDVGIRKVALYACFSLRRTDPEASPLLAVQ